jgi:hypothetical protein
VFLHAGLVIAAPAYAGSVSFAEPLDKTSIISPVHLSMLVQGMDVRPAGKIVFCEEVRSTSAVTLE